MDEQKRWTIRGITASSIEKISEVSENSEYWYTFGFLVNQAISTWYDQLESDETNIPAEY